MSPLDGLAVPLVGAPLAGGPSTPALAAAVSDAGALGFVAAGYKTADEVALELEEVRRLAGRPFGLNLFYPARDEVDEQALTVYVERLRPEAERFGIEPGEPRWSDDDWDAKLELAAREAPAIVSFTFGCPEREVVETLRAAGSAVWCTVTSADEARVAAAVRADALVVQGREAGGHQGSFLAEAGEPLPTLGLLRQVARATDLPLVAAGGIGTAADVAAALAAGATAVAVGTALLRCAEAGTSATHRAALADPARTGTVRTRAFTGRPARGLRNEFTDRYDGLAPYGYPALHHLTSPMRKAAAAAGDPERLHLWAGTGYRQATEEPAGTILTRLANAH